MSSGASSAPITINAERPDSPDASALIRELDADLSPLYPVESRHGFTVDRLLVEKVPFFVLRCAATPAGCGGIKLFGIEYAEVKRMFVRPHFRGKGFAKRMLDHLENHARLRGISLVRLETGIHQTDAIALYEHAGFQRIGPFGEYKPDRLSLFFEKRIIG